MANVISVEVVAAKILLIRGKRVMLDSDLAKLYGVQVKRLNEQVRRNRKRFPEDFMFRLTEDEKIEVVANCDHLKALKFSYQLPYVFTEQGVAMLSGVLSSERAIGVNIAIMRAFVKFKELLLTHKELSIKLDALERKYADHDYRIQKIFEVIRRLMRSPDEENRKVTGFGAK